MTTSENSVDSDTITESILYANAKPAMAHFIVKTAS